MKKTEFYIQTSQLVEVRSKRQNKLFQGDSPAEFYIHRLDENGNIIYTYFNVGGPAADTSLFTQYIMLDGGYDYRLVAEALVPGAYGEIMLDWIDVNVICYTPGSGGVNGLKAGGIRVKSTTDHPINGTPVTTHYSYVKENDPNASSGVLVSQPKYLTNVLYSKPSPCTQGGASGVQVCGYLKQESNSITPLGMSQGSHICYTDVIVEKEGYGKTIYSYSFHLDYPNNSFPYGPATSNDWRRGILLEETHMASDEGGDTKVRAITNAYNFRDNPTLVNNSIIPGLIIRSFDEGILNNDSDLRSSTYDIKAYWTQLDSTREWQDGAQRTTTFEYRPDGLHTNVTASEFINSNGELNRTEYTYAAEAAHSSCLDNNYMIGIPVETIQIIGGTTAFGSKTEFNLNNGKCLADEFYTWEDAWVNTASIHQFNADAFPTDITTRELPHHQTFNWQNGLLASKTYQAWTEQWEYYANSRQLKKHTAIDGQDVEYLYDGFQRLTDIKARDNKILTHIDYEYGAPNKVSTTTTYDDAPTQEEVKFFDGLGRFTKFVHNGVVKDEKIYNNAGLIEAETYLVGSLVKYTYEPSPLGRVHRTIFPDYNYTINTYGAEGDYMKVSTTNERGFTSDQLTDFLGRVGLTRDPNNGETIYTYSKGDLETITPPSGPVYTYEYDEGHRVLSKTIPGAEPQLFRYYSGNKFLKYSIDGNGNRIDYEYDDYGRQIIMKHNFLSGWQPTNQSYIDNTSGQHGSPGSIMTEQIYEENDWPINPNNIGRLEESKTAYLGSQTTSFITEEYTYDAYGRMVGSDITHPFGSDDYTYTYNIADWQLEESRNHTYSGASPITVITKRGYDGFGRELFYNTRVDGEEAIVAIGRSYNEKDQVVAKYYAGLDPYSALDFAKYKYNIRGWLTHINDVVYDLQEANECGELLDTSGDTIQIEQQLTPDDFLDQLCQVGPGITIDDMDPCVEGGCFENYYDFIATSNPRGTKNNHGGWDASKQLSGITFTIPGLPNPQTIILNYPYLYHSSASMSALETDLGNWLDNYGIRYDEVVAEVVLVPLGENRVEFNVSIQILGVEEDFDFVNIQESLLGSSTIIFQSPFQKTLNRIMPCNHAEEPVEPKSQEQSLLDIQAYITALTPASIDYPVRAYQTYLENGTTRWIPEEALPLLTGSYQRGKRIHISSAIENIDVDFQNGTQSTLSIPALLTELAGDIGEDITDIHTESEEPECDNPQFECTPEQQEAQQQSLADIQNAICNMDAEDFTFPLTIYLVQLCGGATAYITGDSLLNEIEGPYAVIDQMVIDETTLISVLVTIQRPLFAMHFSGYQENGNIEQMRWKITNRAVKQYDFSYDPLDRVINADYGYYAVLPLVNGGLKPDLVPSDEYSVPTIGYDAIGNIQSLIRNGMTPGVNNCLEPNEIDNLTYNYDPIKGHLSSLFDNAPAGSRQYGFVPGSTLPKHYAYDNNGNMTTDQHKALFNIKYNFLNLPEEINSLKVGYDATGKKWKKEGQSGITYYINGIEYQGSNLEAIYTGDGRLIAPAPGSGNSDYRAEYFHQDHLGNTRLGFCDFNNNGRVEISDDPNTPTNELEITQEQHYYPFGMNQDGNWYATVNPENKYLYNGKELNTDWDINLYEYGARWYDPAIGRFTTIDRFAEKYNSYSPYSYAAGNPIKFIDVNGDSIKLNFIGENTSEAMIGLVGMISNSLEGQFNAKFSNFSYDKESGSYSAMLEINSTEGGGDISKMSLHGQEFHRELTDLINSNEVTTVNVDYARADVHTGNFNNGTIDVADMLQFNKNLSDLGGTQGGKLIHELREQYGKQVLGGRFHTAHASGIQAENNVNLSIRRDGGSDRTSATQIFTGPGGTVKNRIIFENRRIIKVQKQ